MSNFAFIGFYIVLTIVGLIAFLGIAALRNADDDYEDIIGDGSLLGREDTNA